MSGKISSVNETRSTTPMKEKELYIQEKSINSVVPQPPGSRKLVLKVKKDREDF